MIIVTYIGMPSHKVEYSLVILLSVIISRIIYGKQEVTGALWCFIAAFAPLVYFLTQKIKN